MLLSVVLRRNWRNCVRSKLKNGEFHLAPLRLAMFPPYLFLSIRLQYITFLTRICSQCSSIWDYWSVKCLTCMCFLISLSLQHVDVILVQGNSSDTRCIFRFNCPLSEQLKWERKKLFAGCCHWIYIWCQICTVWLGWGWCRYHPRVINTVYGDSWLNATSEFDTFRSAGGISTGGQQYSSWPPFTGSRRIGPRTVFPRTENKKISHFFLAEGFPYRPKS